MVTRQTVISCGISNKNKIRRTVRAGFQNTNNSCMSAQRAYRYVPEAATSVVSFRDVVSVNWRHLIKRRYF
jgi:hypothetical protein